MRRREWMVAYAFLFPWLIGALLLVVYQLLQSFRFSLSDVRVSGGLMLRYIGLDNYISIFSIAGDFLLEVVSFAIRVVTQVPIILAFSLMMALLINRPFKGRTLCRALFFLPAIIVSGPVMNMFTAQGVMSIPLIDTAAIAQAINSFFPSWLGQPIADVFSSLLRILWNSGVQIVLLLSGLQKTPRAMYEAAKIDGASAWECFWKITLPTVKPLLLLCAVYTTVSMSADANNRIIQMILRAMYGLDLNRGYGFASAMAWVYVVAVALLLIFFWIILHDRERKAVKEVWRRL